MPRLPAIYIPSIYARRPSLVREGTLVDTLEETIDLLAEADVRAPAMGSLLGGTLRIEPDTAHVLLMLGDSRLQAVGPWARAVAAGGLTTLVGCSWEDFGSAGHIGPSDAALLTGHGVTVASSGLDGQPLVGLGLEALRRQLADSRARLCEALGYPVYALMPTPTALGRAVDGLVLEEARRAGYRLILRPGAGLTDFDESPPDRRPFEVVEYRTLLTDENPEDLRDWVLGRGLSRQRTRLRDLVNQPRRILARFGRS
jgi:hypothetical protein